MISSLAGWIAPRNRVERERGAILALVALGLFALGGAVALGIDTGRMFSERRGAQSAADHAATAAAHHKCTGMPATDAAAIAAGQAAATRNGYTTGGTTAVAITPLGGTTFEAGIRRGIPPTFGRLIGFSNYDVSVVATARADGCGSGGSGPGAIFAGGTCADSGQYAVDISGSTQHVYGGVHSNDDVSVGGGSNDFDDVGADPFTYVNTIKSGSIGNGNLYETGYPAQVAAKAWPAGYEPAAAAPGATNDAYWNLWRDRAVADGHGGSLLTSKISTITTGGVYYTDHTDGMDIGSVPGGVTNVTLIARNGPIKISASSGNISPDPDAGGLLMLSGKVQPTDKRCTDYTISLSGGSTTWNGIIWSPGGLIEFSGSSNTAMNGTLIGWAIRLNGSNITIRYQASLFPAANPDVLLLQ